jgi:hypothetical protein
VHTPQAPAASPRKRPAESGHSALNAADRPPHHEKSDQPRDDCRPRRRRARMLFFGPVSSLFDFLTFWVMLHV